ncbi:Two-component sensor histidine kinase [Acidisarcina polymorpha]|uniref:histidine kinase n=1 Tax=Acidisarcina polymorpha TaxID=2211140 RepID=A0A2Z5FZK2_9BACT|nr:histidine kinase [Acidisarcina polymorpha]AXC12288.1 Two-component sensor histidine kinase [Acidisarcina polymorpha]
MGALDQPSTAGLIGQTYGFAVGTALATLLMVLVWRSGGADRRSRFLFVACILIADLSGLAKNVALVLYVSPKSPLAGQIRSIGFIAAAMLPLSIMTIWRNNAVLGVRRLIGNALVIYSASSGFLIAACLAVGSWTPSYLSSDLMSGVLLNQDFVGNLTIYNGLLLILVGAIFLLPGTLDNLTDRIAISLMISGLFLSSVSAALDAYVSLPLALAHIIRIARFQSIVLVVIGSLFYFSRFRAADIFAKQAMRLLLGSILAMVMAFGTLGPIASMSHVTASPRAVTLLGAAMIAGCAMLLYVRLGRWTDLLVERGIFGKRDTQLAIREFSDHLGVLESKAIVLSTTQALAVEVLGMKSDEVSVRDIDRLDGEPNCVSLPILHQGDTLYLAVPLTGNRRILLTAEVESLREIALHAGRRLDELDREEERMASLRLESRLSRQLVEAELRALRAQINPHFLFNSLNTIAALIPQEPEKAEKFTVRLAKVFRYVLLHADRPLSAIDEEMDFLRTYLEIEQIRFGERLLVEFDVERAIAHTAVPSLILQPLVENAIKHGIAPKVGTSRILVQAKRRNGLILLSVEDDGIGLFASKNQLGRSLASADFGAGVGLQNVRERLQTMYGAAANLSLINIQGGGSRATLEIPAGE